VDSFAANGPNHIYQDEAARVSHLAYALSEVPNLRNGTRDWSRVRDDKQHSCQILSLDLWHIGAQRVTHSRYFPQAFAMANVFHPRKMIFLRGNSAKLTILARSVSRSTWQAELSERVVACSEVCCEPGITCAMVGVLRWLHAARRQVVR